MNYISAQQAADKWGISKRRVQKLCTDGRINEATRIGNMWVLPESADKPSDARVQMKQRIQTPAIREARTALKKLTVSSFQSINDELNDPTVSKMTYICLLATTVFLQLQGSSNSECNEKVFTRLCSDFLASDPDLSIIENYFHRFSSLTEKMGLFINRYAEYIEDILSWAYQYVNKISLDSGLENTQFFTEKYMIDYLTSDASDFSASDGVFFDPACGGGNFLSCLLEKLVSSCSAESSGLLLIIQKTIAVLYGYELDPKLASVASINLKIKALKLLSKERQITLDDWDLFCPNIYTSADANPFGFIDSDLNEHIVKRASDGHVCKMNELIYRASYICTNPPFQTIKGMPVHLKDHLRKFFPEAKCDLCNAFILQCIEKAHTGSSIRLVTQSSWLYLDSFADMRRKALSQTSIKTVADLGSGAFFDLNGEKANVALVSIDNTPGLFTDVAILPLREYSLKDKIEILNNPDEYILRFDITRAFSGKYMSFSPMLSDAKDTAEKEKEYGDFATPMQGTSTGNAAELIGFYWEHLNDPQWVPVSKGGGYSRWCGLNNYVLKWGIDGEFICETKGSALRNTKYFDRTELVFSDTGTSGFNARLLRKGQLFVASGPGIRDITGSPYAHLALLNSRFFSYYLRNLSPKLTIAAGYVSRVPVPTGIFENPEIDRLGKACFLSKNSFLRSRPNNIEWAAPVINSASIKAYAETLFITELREEFFRLTHEGVIDRLIMEQYSFNEADRRKIDDSVGILAIDIGGKTSDIELDNLIAQALDENCQLIRTRADKHSLGCDGILEYVSRKSHMSPEAILALISQQPDGFPLSKTKYLSLAIHGLVLAALGFRTGNEGVGSLSDLENSFLKVYPMLKGEWPFVKEWIEEKFNLVHYRSFASRPYFHYENGKFSVLY